MSLSLEKQSRAKREADFVQAVRTSRGLRGGFLHRRGEVVADERRSAELWARYGFSVDAIEDNSDRYSREPDLKLSLDGVAVALCEVKTIWQHTWTVNILHDDRPVEVKEGRNEKPVHERISDDLVLTIRQLQAGNPDHALLNFVVLVNRDPEVVFADLIDTLFPKAKSEGNNGGRASELKDRRMAEISREIAEFRRDVDFCLWINADDNPEFEVGAVLVGNAPVLKQLESLTRLGSKQLIELNPAQSNCLTHL